MDLQLVCNDLVFILLAFFLNLFVLGNIFAAYVLIIQVFIIVVNPYLHFWQNKN
jgi:hypothetical protein